MQQLKSLELRNPTDNGLGDIVRKGGDTLINPGVTRLTLYSEISPDVETKLRSHFPNCIFHFANYFPS